MPRIKMSKDIPLMEQARGMNTETLTKDFEFYLQCLVAGGNVDKKAFSVLDVILHELTRRHIPMQVSVSWGHSPPRARQNTNVEYAATPPPLRTNPLPQTLASGRRRHNPPALPPEMMRPSERITTGEEQGQVIGLPFGGSDSGRYTYERLSTNTGAWVNLNEPLNREEQHGQE